MEKWEELQAKGEVDMTELYRLVYFGGMAHSLRRKLWPIMLAGNVKGDDPEALRREYEDRMSEWLAVEAIVRQRDRETMAANLAKLSSEGTTSSEPQASPGVFQTHGSNEVLLLTLLTFPLFHPCLFPSFSDNIHIHFHFYDVLT